MASNSPYKGSPFSGKDETINTGGEGPAINLFSSSHGSYGATSSVFKSSSTKYTSIFNNNSSDNSQYNWGNDNSQGYFGSTQNVTTDSYGFTSQDATQSMFSQTDETSNGGFSRFL